MSQIDWNSISEKAWLTPNEVARLLMVSPVTVRQWAAKGELNAELTPGGHRRFRPEEVRRFSQNRVARKSTPSSRVMRVLLVDDDPHMLTLLAEMIRSHDKNIIVEKARDGFEAGRKMAMFGPDKVVLDIMMPGIDGFEVCQQIKSDALTRHVEVIAVTGFHEPEIQQKILNKGAKACLLKPIDREMLLDALGFAEQYASA